MSGTMTIGKVRLVDEYISDQIDSIEQEQLAVSGRMTAVEQTVATLDSVALSTRVTTAEQDIDALEEEDTVLAVATTALSTRVTAAEQDINALETKDVTLAAAATAVSNRVTTTESDIAALEAQDTVLAADTTAVSDRVTSIADGLDLVYGGILNVGASAEISTNGNVAHFGHPNFSNTDYSGLRQDHDGVTVIACTGHTIMRVDGEAMVSVYSDKVTLAKELQIDQSDSSTIYNTHFNYQSGGSNYISSVVDGKTHFRFGSSISVVVEDKEIAIDGTNVLEKLNNFEARITDIETFYADTRKTFNIRNHVANKYLDGGGNLNASKSSTNAHYSIEFD